MFLQIINVTNLLELFDSLSLKIIYLEGILGKKILHFKLDLAILFQK